MVIPLVERDLSTIKILPSCYNIFLKQRNYPVMLMEFIQYCRKEAFIPSPHTQIMPFNLPEKGKGCLLPCKLTSGNS